MEAAEVRGRREFTVACYTILRECGVDVRLGAGPAIVLERLARGGGATNWYAIDDVSQLEMLVSLVRPGSRVSFYFDDRLRWMTLNDLGMAFAKKMIASTGDVVVAQRQPGTIELAVTIVSGAGELVEKARDFVNDTVLVGGFPAPESDGVAVITVDLPDLDGEIRSHPH